MLPHQIIKNTLHHFRPFTPFVVFPEQGGTTCVGECTFHYPSMVNHVQIIRLVSWDANQTRLLRRQNLEDLRYYVSASLVRRFQNYFVKNAYKKQMLK
jgi:hypothetical protein